MMILRFRNNEDHEELLMKVKRMKKFTQELEDCLEEALEDTPEYRGGYRKDYDEEGVKSESRYARMGRRGGGR